MKKSHFAKISSITLKLLITELTNRSMVDSVRYRNLKVLFASHYQRGRNGQKTKEQYRTMG